jgi:hypothetical protein
VLYGGAAGSAKSDVLIIDALGGQCGAVQLPEYRAPLLRRTFPELRETVDRTQAVYPKVIPGAVYVKPEWRFPSGARLSSAISLLMVNVMRYQSRQFQWIGWEEELAQWPTSYPYVYLLSRLRRPERLNIPARSAPRATPKCPVRVRSPRVPGDK